MADLVERHHGIKLYRNDETGLLRKFSYRPRHGQWTLMHSVDPAPWQGKAELIERLRAHADNYAATGLTHELCRAAAAALEAEASKGERRGLEPTDAMLACFSDPMLSPEWVRKRLRAVLALIPEASVRKDE